MLRFIVRRLLVSIPLLILASMVTFLLVVNIGDPLKLENLRARPGVSPAAIAQLRQQYDLDQPLVSRYWSWVSKFARLDFGKDSEQTNVRSDLWRAMQVTLRLVLAALIISVVLGVVVGMISAVRQYSAFDYIMTGLAFFFFSIPVAVFASLLKEFGAIKLNDWLRTPSMSGTVMLVLLGLGLLCGWAVMRNRYRYEREKPFNKMLLGAVVGFAVAAAFVLVFKVTWDGNVYRVTKTASGKLRPNPKGLIPTVGQQTPGFKGNLFERLQDYFWHLLLPSLTLIVISFAGYSRFMRASMLDTMNSDYVRTARAKGLTEGRVIFRHAFRNALIPLTTQVALDFGFLLSGAIITETVFGWSGMGKFFSDALTNKEPNPLLAFVMVIAVTVVVFNLIADIAYAKLDPRIRLD